MKPNLFTTRLITVSTVLVITVLVTMPFHAFLTVWLNSLVGHYTALRLWKEVVLVFLMTSALYLLARDKALRTTFVQSKMYWLIIAYGFVALIWGGIAYLAHGVTLKAMGYGLIIDTRFLLFFLAVLVLVSAKPTLLNNWPKLIFIPAAVVVGIGLLQYFLLPYDFLRHFGYSATTIFPYATINHNINYIRIMSTLRGANPLGAYLLLVLSLLGALWLKFRQRWQLILGLFSFGALILTFSRSAWIGFVLAMGVLACVALRTKKAQQIAGISLAVFAIVVGSSAFILRNNAAFQNAFLHTSDNSTVKVSSNDGHESALREGLKDVAHHPLGQGTGTAGPASVYNNDHAKIAENYFVQVAQETGIIGLALFVAIQIFAGRELWRRRQEPLALGLFAALIGLTFVNLLSHAWADDTLVYIFWGLAGVAVARNAAKTKKA